MLSTAGPASAYNPCWGDNPPPRCSDPRPIPTPTPPPEYNEAVAVTAGPPIYNGPSQWQQTTVTLIIVHDTATKAELRAYLRGITTTHNDLAFAGFHAAAWVTAGPAYVETARYRYGVDGTVFGTSERTDVWTEAVPLSVADADRGGALYTHSTFG
jgi:hypothetical protein